MDGRTHYFNAEQFFYNTESRTMSAELSDIGCMRFPSIIRSWSNATGRLVEFTLAHVDRHNFQAIYLPQSLDGNPTNVKRLVLFND